MKKTLLLAFQMFSSLLLISLLVSCGNSQPTVSPSLPISEFSFNFENDTEGWMTSFLGYSDTNKEAFNFQTGIETIPDINSNGLLLSADNPNAQLVMYAQKKLSGLTPNQDYNLLYIVGLGSNLSSETNCDNFQGKRTEMKVSASVREPKAVLEENLELLDLGTGPFQRVGVVGHKGRSCEATDYAINKLDNIKAPFNAPIKVKSDANGAVWAVIVLDSSYEGKSTFYLDSVDITATPVKK